MGLAAVEAGEGGVAVLGGGGEDGFCVAAGLVVGGGPGFCVRVEVVADDAEEGGAEGGGGGGGGEDATSAFQTSVDGAAVRRASLGGRGIAAAGQADDDESGGTGEGPGGEQPVVAGCCRLGSLTVGHDAYASTRRSRQARSISDHRRMRAGDSRAAPRLWPCTTHQCAGSRWASAA